MFPRRAHLLAPITRLQSKDVPFEWTPKCQQAFDQVKALICQETLLAYPDPNQPFDIYTDASDLQLGAVIKQHDKPFAFYSCKLSSAQRNYSTIEKELLSIVETFHEFKTFLYGAKITVFTDHSNLTQVVEHTNARITRWRLFLEDFNPTFRYLPGPSNVIADGLSRSALKEEQKELLVPQIELHKNPQIESHKIQLHEVFAFYPPNAPAEELYPMDFELIATRQQEDQVLQADRNRHPNKYDTIAYPTANGAQDLICYRANENNDWQIYIPSQLVPQVTNWYHHVQGHPGADRLYQAIMTHFYCPNFKEYAKSFVDQCVQCQQHKLTGPGRGELPPKNITANPWDEVAVDLIGPWHFKINNQEYTFCALTCIDPLTTFCEIIKIDDATSLYVSSKFDMEWLSRYPRPLRCIHNQGNKFTSAPFQLVLQVNGIKDVPTTVKNPQANAVNERLHQTMGNVLRTFLNSPAATQVPPHVLIDFCFSSTRYALRSSINRSLNMSPGSLVFSRDMFLPIPLLADIEAIKQQRQLKVDTNLLRQNKRRLFHDYQPGDQVLIINRDIKRKLDSTTSGPYSIVEVHANGTVVIQRRAHVYERINIRRLKPYNA
jgi:transposase InsO family protein